MEVQPTVSNEEEKRDNEQYSKNFTRTPNILFVAFPDLSKEEKFLYIELRMVYWDMKPRFVTLRELGGLVHYSTGSLSKMLPRLHDAGLIHAEVRREKARNGREKGNSKYHISIVDIWEVNRLFFSCSPDEQDKLSALPSAQLVQEMNKNNPNAQPVREMNNPVHTTNKLVREMNNPVSFGEQDRAARRAHKRAQTHPKDILKDTSKDILKDKSIGRDSQTLDDSGSTEPTHAPSTHAQSEDAASIVREVEQDSPDRTDTKGHTHAHASGNNAHRPAATHAADSRVAQDMAASLAGAGSVTEMPSQLPTTDVDKSAQGGKVAPEKPKRTRAPKTPTISPDDLDLYRRVFDDCRREALDDESEGYPHTKASDDCIAKLLELNRSRPRFVTPQKLHAVFVHMWNLPKDERSGFHWRNKMSIKAICNNYETFALELTTIAKEKQRQSRPITTEEARKQAREKAQAGELLGGLYPYIVSSDSPPLQYMSAAEQHAIYGGK